MIKLDLDQEQRFYISVILIICISALIGIFGAVGCVRHRYDLNYQLLSGRLDVNQSYDGDRVEASPIEGVEQ